MLGSATDPAVLVGAVCVAIGVVLAVAGLGATRRSAGAPGEAAGASGGLGGSTGRGARSLELSLPARLLAPLAERIGRLAPGSAQERRSGLRRAIARAGLESVRRPEEIVAAQVLAGATGAVLGMLVMSTGKLSLPTSVFVTAVLAISGFAAPMTWLNRRGDERDDRIRHDLADFLDLLAVSVEAGLGLEAAMDLVSAKLDSPLADEMRHALHEMELGSSRRDALENLRRRTPVSELSTFVQSLVQADALGMPLGRVLRSQALDMRSRRRQWARERAAKLPVKILLPLVFCIFPAVLVVVLGPAFSSLSGLL